MTGLISIGFAALALTQQVSPTEVARAVDRFAERAMGERITAALGVAIVMNGRTIYERSFGFADASAGIRADTNTLWYLASTSKSFTGVAISLLARRGVVDMNAPITTLLPIAKWSAKAQPEKLTLTNFLTHTSGLDGAAVVMSAAFTGCIPESQWPSLLAYSEPLARRDMVYSNLGYNVAAMVIDAKYPMGWRSYLEQEVFRPAGMRETYHRVSGIDARRFAKPHAVARDLTFLTRPFMKTDATMNSAGGHIATLGDLARWLIVNMQHGVIDGRRMLDSSAIASSHRQLMEHTIPANRTFGPFARTGWAAGWDIGSYEGAPMVSRFGAYETIRSHLSFLPGRRIGVVAMTTSASGSALTDAIAAYAYDLEAGRPDALARAETRLDSIRVRHRSIPARLAAADSARLARQQPLPEMGRRYAGRYRHPAYGEIAVFGRDGVLRYEFGAYSGTAEVFNVATNQLRLDFGGSGMIATFKMDSTRATELRLVGPGDPKNIDVVFTVAPSRVGAEGHRIPLGTDSAAIYRIRDGARSHLTNTSWHIDRTDFEGRAVLAISFGQPGNFVNYVDAISLEFIAVSVAHANRDSASVRVRDGVASGWVSSNGGNRRTVADTLRQAALSGAATDYILGAYPLQAGFEMAVDLYSPGEGASVHAVRVTGSDSIVFRKQLTATWIVEVRRSGDNQLVRTLWIDKASRRLLRRDHSLADGSRIEQITW